MKSAADNIYSPSLFELLNCETTENDENNQSYDKDTSIVYSDTKYTFSKHKESKRPEEVVTRFPENQHNFQKKCTLPGEKTYKEAGKLITNNYPHQ